MADHDPPGTPLLEETKVAIKRHYYGRKNFSSDNVQPAMATTEFAGMGRAELPLPEYKRIPLYTSNNANGNLLKIFTVQPLAIIF